MNLLNLIYYYHCFNLYFYVIIYQQNIKRKGREKVNYKIVNGAISYGADTILEEINFEIKDKEKIAIVGRNGSGKTTLLKSIIDNSMLEEGIGEQKFSIYKQGSPVLEV